MIRKIIKFIIICFLSLPFPAIASKYAGEFLNIGLGSAAMGMGGAYVSIASDAFAGYWNPAGTFSAGHQIIFAHSNNFSSLVAHDALGYSRPMGQYALGLVYIRLSVKDIPYTSEALIDLNNNGIMDAGERLDYSKIIYNDDVESALLLNYSRKYNPDTRWGLNLKFVNKSVGPSSAWGLGLDAGLMTAWREKIKFGINLQDLTTTYLAWDNGTKEVITPTVRLGASYHPSIAGERPMALALGGDFRFEGRQSAANYHLGSMSLDLHLGLEYWLKKRIALRLGGDQGRFTAGAGLKLGRFNFDYAYMAHKYLESSTRLSGAFTF
jgi:hypothetical protein